ncbi:MULTISPECIES: serine hydrolase domain-containing protein [unclassified Robiginitalea]|uniref:serine hydrolase domain-containing protein n=1 Tax=Robiginitalea TaxID=252306 RepID=UPI00234A118E|nr:MULTISPECIES: serine hydrolase [unclassified Robiginitalea]MDC6354780.1 serine hydrolase [Robiginitalea sp. PM2]MDC6375046.1 serine hydrolase [Robiginitalea sp. SP8]
MYWPGKKISIAAAATLLVLLAAGVSCTSDTEPADTTPPAETGRYFPDPVSFAEWETTDPSDLGWDSAAESDLDTFLASSGTRALIILKSGRIAKETYFGTFTRDSLWYWASAGKTLTAFSVGLAVQEGFIDTGDATSDYLGAGWTSAPAEKEALITVGDQLRMTTGLNDLAFDCVSPGCLQYLADAGERWAYHNGPYTLLQSVVAAGTSESFTAFFNSRLRNRIGMDGLWFSTNGSNNVYFSTARSMARFGLLVLGRGSWGDTEILVDGDFLEDMLTPSQSLNASYGYLWWLNGKSSYMLPASQVVFPGELMPQAPSDLLAGLGKNDQKLYIVPSQELVIIRMGDDAGESLAGPSSFDNTLWQHLSAYMNL